MPPQITVPGTLLRLLSGADADPTPDLRESEWAALFELAAEQRVSTLLLDRLAPGAAAQRKFDELTRECRRITARNLGIQHTLTTVLASLEAAGVATVLLKGAHLCRGVYRHAGLREMNDLDLLIRPDDVIRASGVLHALGYAFMTPFTPTAEFIGGHHVPRMLKPGAAPVELHVAITPPTAQLRLDIEDLWRRAVPVETGSRHFVLSPEDLVLHICVHAAYTHSAEFGLRPLCDIQQIVRVFPALDWTAVGDRAREWRAARGTFLTLHLAAECLGACIPTRVLDDLRPAGFDTAMAQLVRTHLFTRKALSLSVTVEAARTFAAGTLAARLRHVLRRVFIPRSELAVQFPAAAGATIPAWHYVRRIASLARRYAGLPTSVALGRDQELSAMIRRRNVILKWLEVE